MGRHCTLPPLRPPCRRHFSQRPCAQPPGGPAPPNEGGTDPEGDLQAHQGLRPAEAAMVLPDVPGAGGGLTQHACCPKLVRLGQRSTERRCAGWRKGCPSLDRRGVQTPPPVKGVQTEGGKRPNLSFRLFEADHLVFLTRFCPEVAQPVFLADFGEVLSSVKVPPRRASSRPPPFLDLFFNHHERGS